MNGTVMRVLALLITATPLAVGCSSDGSDADLDRLERELSEVTTERDSLTEDVARLHEQLTNAVAAAGSAADVDGVDTASRYQQALANQQLLISILADPAGFGTEAEVMEALTSLLAPDEEVVMDDAAFGAMPLPQTWELMLFGRRDSTVTTWHSWLDDDGSTGGSLWTWSGTAESGDPFELVGVNIFTFDDEGLLTNTWNTYAVDAADARRALQHGN